MVKKLLWLLLGLLLTGTVVMAGWYRIDGIPTEETEEFMAGDGFSSVEEEDGSLIFTPAVSNGYGILIMHGALILPRSYARSAAYFASRGYTVYLPKGLGRMSIAVVDTAADRIAEFDIEDWFFIGHSMGGMASLAVIADRDIDAKGVALWATAMPRDFSEVDTPILFIWGDTDGLLPRERFELARENLPQSVTYVTLEGANHKNFSMYSHQFFDSEATIDWMAQIDFANERTAAFFRALR